MAERPVFTLREAAAAAGVSVDTMKRRRAAGAFPAARLEDGAWVIPLEDLLAAGFALHSPTVPDGPPQAAPEPQAAAEGRMASLERENELLRAQLAERDRALALVERLVLALPAAAAEPQGGAPARRRWFRRR